ncbi:hypothetical protein BsWGS_28847 [Bradybaena similaris]
MKGPVSTATGISVNERSCLHSARASVHVLCSVYQ